MLRSVPARWPEILGSRFACPRMTRGEGGEPALVVRRARGYRHAAHHEGFDRLAACGSGCGFLMLVEDKACFGQPIAVAVTLGS